MDKGTFSILKTVLYLFTVFILIITNYIRKLILSAKGQHRQATQGFEHLGLQKYAAAMIVAWALLESIGIFGLVLFLLGKNPMDLYLLVAISAAALSWHRPKKDELIGLA